MNKLAAQALLAMGFGLAGGAFAQAAGQGVSVVADEAHRRVDITFDGKPFTSYIWPTSLKKPVLYPLVDEDGIPVTRGYPLEQRAGERVDHPHQAGLWFNYGDVNGFDFWNNSNSVKPEARGKMGTILHSRVVSTRSGPNQGELVVEAVWVAGDDKEILKQTTRYVFMRREHARVIDLEITLKAMDHVVFYDDKEGLLGLRVTSWLESPEEKGGVFMDAHGNPTQVDTASATPNDPNPASGSYRTSEGAQGAAAWGTRGRWCHLTGHSGDHTADIAIFDHPQNVGYPTYWHARGYGLFAANPLGRSVFDPKQHPLNFTLEKGESATFRYRVIIYSSTAWPAQLDREADAFAAAPE